MTFMHLAGAAEVPEPGPQEVSGHEPDDERLPVRRHLSLIVTVDGATMTRSRQESMARHPSVKRSE